MNKLEKYIANSYEQLGYTNVKVKMHPNNAGYDIWFIPPNPLQYITFKFTAQEKNENLPSK